MSDDECAELIQRHLPDVIDNIDQYADFNVVIYRYFASNNPFSAIITAPPDRIMCTLSILQLLAIESVGYARATLRSIDRAIQRNRFIRREQNILYLAVLAELDHDTIVQVARIVR
jgi:hypothetical protein